MAGSAVAGLLYAVGWRQVAAGLASAEPAVVALAVLASLAGTAVSADGVRVAMGVSRVAPDRRLACRAAVGGMFVGAVLPAGGLGKAAFTAYVVGRSDAATTAQAVGGVTGWEVAKMAASATVAVAGVAGVLAAGGAVETAGLVAAAFGGVCVTGVAAGALVVRRRRLVVGLAVWLLAGVARVLPGRWEPPPRERVRAGLDAALESVGVLARTPQRLAAVTGAAHAAWLCSALALVLCLHAVGLRVSPAVALVALPVAGFAHAIPVPGGLGPVDAALGGVIAALTGHALATLASALVLFRVATYGTRVVVGGVALWRLRAALR